MAGGRVVDIVAGVLFIVQNIAHAEPGKVSSRPACFGHFIDLGSNLFHRQAGKVEVKNFLDDFRFSRNDYQLLIFVQPVTERRLATGVPAFSSGCFQAGPCLLADEIALIIGKEQKGRKILYRRCGYRNDLNTIQVQQEKEYYPIPVIPRQPADVK